IPMPEGFSLGTPYPNPFNHAINVPVELSSSGDVRITVFDLAGRKMWSEAKLLNAGQSLWSISGESWGSGVFIIKAESTGISSIQKIVLMK
ncbi:T9SS type A sorting domain-containing protein, partial [bacterium]|nr:T9SS type A sorting domain-containing protein [bacterium]